jgi:phosphoribosylaminoimidazole-succinocarboxamide synthase
MSDVLNIPGVHIHSGKVRDLYALSDRVMLMIASDRVSAYDHVLATPIPDKGRILTQLSLWWFDQLVELCPNHVVSRELPEGLPIELAGRSFVCERLEMVPVECVARGYLAGSGLIDYLDSGEICGVPLPDGLVEGSRLSAPIFTPTTKAPVGSHDQRLSYDQVVDSVGAELAGRLRELTLAVYARAEELARERGIIVADTKIEIGLRPDGSLVLADELLTPDSSRFWPAADWRPGRPQPSFDKQIVRDWLTSPTSGWDKESSEPPPPLPHDVVERTRQRYLEVCELLTGDRADLTRALTSEDDPIG